MGKIWFVDTETGGFDSTRHSILSLAMVEWVDGRILRTYEAFVDESPIVVTRGALGVNKIDLRDVEIDWKSPRNVVSVICDMVQDSSDPRPTLGGHNVMFDKGFLLRLFAMTDTQDPFSDHTVDTMGIARFLMDGRRIPKGSCKLIDLCTYYGIPHDAHTALGDALATARLYTCFLDEITKLEVTK